MKPLALGLFGLGATDGEHIFVCDRRHGRIPRFGDQPGAALSRLMRLDIRHLPWHWLTMFAPTSLLWASIGLTLWQDHTAARKGPENDTANLARSFDDSITRTVEAVDQTLLFIREGYQNDRAAYAPQAWAQSRS